MDDSPGDVFGGVHGDLSFGIERKGRLVPVRGIKRFKREKLLLELLTNILVESLACLVCFVANLCLVGFFGRRLARVLLEIRAGSMGVKCYFHDGHFARCFGSFLCCGKE